MSNSKSEQVRKDKLLLRLNSLSPRARKAILQAALELMSKQKLEKNKVLQNTLKEG